MKTKSIKKCIFLSVVLFGFYNPAYACKMVQDTRPISEKIQQSQLAFIGTVIKVQDKVAVFEVDTFLKSVKHPIEGVVIEKKRVSVEMGGTSCHHRFSEGQRWLYSGNSYLSGSVLLGQDTGASIGVYKQPDLKNKPNWVAWDVAKNQCTQNHECSVLYYGCNGVLAVSEKIKQNGVAHGTSGRGILVSSTVPPIPMIHSKHHGCYLGHIVLTTSVSFYNYR